MSYHLQAYITLLLMLGLMLVTTIFAFWKGGPPERMGAAVIVIVWIGTIAAQMLPVEVHAISLLVSDGLAAVGFLAVAIRYSSLWLGSAMICQAVSFVAHAIRLSDDTRVLWHGFNVFILVVNIASFLVLLILVGGTVATIGQRRRADRQRVEDRARIVKRPDWLTDATPPTAGAL